MKSKKQKILFSWIVRNLVSPALFLSFFIASSAGAGSEIPTMSESNTGEALLIAATLALAALGLIVSSLISWGRRQDAISEAIKSEAKMTSLR